MSPQSVCIQHDQFGVKALKILQASALGKCEEQLMHMCGIFILLSWFPSLLQVERIMNWMWK